MRGARVERIQEQHVHAQPLSEQQAAEAHPCGERPVDGVAGAKAGGGRCGAGAKPAVGVAASRPSKKCTIEQTCKLLGAKTWVQR